MEDAMYSYSSDYDYFGTDVRDYPVSAFIVPSPVSRLERMRAGAEVLRFLRQGDFTVSFDCGGYVGHNYLHNVNSMGDVSLRFLRGWVFSEEPELLGELHIIV
jgi:hypothetical protein